MNDVPRDHGGGLDAAIAKHGGSRPEWIDLSTGINPVPYPLSDFAQDDWTALPDAEMSKQLEDAARRFWSIPKEAAVLAAPGASALIARIPALASPGTVAIEAPTYNEHAASFAAAGWNVAAAPDRPAARVLVHPNNPTGTFQTIPGASPLRVIDESFCDIAPERSMIGLASEPGVLILKSFGKFWGLAGLRLGFAIGDPRLVDRLAEGLGPWPVAGPALRIGAAALQDQVWADDTRRRLSRDAARLDQHLEAKGAVSIGGTPLFRLYEVDVASAWQERLASAKIWSRIFPYSDRWLRLGIPAPAHFDRLEAAL